MYRASITENTLETWVNLPDSLFKAFDTFTKIYDLNWLAFPPLTLTPMIKSRERKCRFCEPNNNQKFKNQAHIVPEFFGRNQIISYEECDECNKLFSIYENSLASYLLGIHSSSAVRGKKKIPTYKSIFHDFRIETKENVVNFKGDYSENLIFDQDERKLTSKIQVPPYNPMHIYKTFAKIIIGLIQEEELKQYTILKELLQSPTAGFISRSGINPYTNLVQFTIPGPKMNGLFVLVGRLKNSQANLDKPNLTLLMQTNNISFQTFFPSDTEIERRNRNVNKDINLIFCPPMVDIAHLNVYGSPKGSLLNLGRNLLVKDENQTVTMQLENIKGVHFKMSRKNDLGSINQYGKK